MPIYEFQCAKCGTRSEQLMRLSDPDPVECPACGEPALERMLSAPSFRLAGGGWYETDFKGDKDRKRNLAGDGGEAKADAAKSDPAPAPAPKPDSGGAGAASGSPQAAAKTSSPATPSAPPKPAPEG